MRIVEQTKRRKEHSIQIITKEDKNIVYGGTTMGGFATDIVFFSRKQVYLFIRDIQLEWSRTTMIYKQQFFFLQNI